MDTYEVVCGATGQTLRIPLVDGNGQTASPSGEVAVALQGASLDLPGVILNVTGVYESATNMAAFPAAGAIFSSQQLGAKPRARFTSRVMWNDVNGTIHTPELTVQFIRLARGVEASEEPMYDYKSRAQIIEDVLWRRTLRIFDLNELTGWVALKRPNAAAWVDNLEPPIARPVNSAGANRIWHVLFETMPNDDAIGIGDLWHRLRYRFGAMVSPGTVAGGSPSMQAGIALGTPYAIDQVADMDPPWLMPPPKPYIRFGIRPAAGTRKYFVEVAKGDGIQPLYTAEIGDWTLFDAPFLEILWDPFARKISFLNMGAVVHEYAELAGLPIFGGLDVVDQGTGGAACLFAESGSDPAAMIQGYFSSCRATIEHPTTLGAGATMWYPEGSV